MNEIPPMPPPIKRDYKNLQIQYINPIIQMRKGGGEEHTYAEFIKDSYFKINEDVYFFYNKDGFVKSVHTKICVINAVT